MNELASGTTLLRQAFDLVKAKAKVLYGISAITYVAALIMVLVVGGGAIGSVVVGGNTGLVAGGAISIVAVFLFVIVALWVQVALFQAIIHEYSFSEAFAANAMIRPYLATCVLSGIIIILGFALLIVPGIIFMVWYSFAGLIVLTEGLTGMAALRQSKAYVKGRWGAVAWRIFFVSIIIWIVSIIVQLVLNMFSPNAASIASTVIAFLSVPLISAYQYLFYQNLRITTLPEAPAPVSTLPDAPTPGQ